MRYFKYLTGVYGFCFCFFICFIPQVLFCENELPPNVQKLIEKAFTKNTQETVIAFIKNGIENFKTSGEKISGLLILADYEERCDLFSDAVSHYLQAADIAAKPEKQILIKALGAAVLADDIVKAIELSQFLQGLVQYPLSEEDAKIIIYSEWVKLKSYEEGSKEFSQVILSLKKYVTDLTFEKFHPALLLTLWWIEDDKKAENTLLKKFPNSIEAGIVKGETILSPKTFWYLLPRNYSFIKNSTEISASIPNRAESSKKDTANSSKIKFYQTGFFKTENYANALSDELTKKGFSASVKKEERASGIFYSVLVAADKNGDVQLRLKQEGYEAVAVFE